MRLRATLVADLDIPDRKAVERYGSMDPMVVARRVQSAAGDVFGNDMPPDVTAITLTVVPLYG